MYSAHCLLLLLVVIVSSNIHDHVMDTLFNNSTNIN